MNPKRLLTSTVTVLLLAAIALAVALGSGSAATNRAAAARAASELTTRHTSIGQILVDGRGRSLYLFEADGRNRSNLSRAGLKVWPAFTVGPRPRAAGGVNPRQLSVINTRGVMQLAYFGHPLYYFAGDEKPGDTAGQGLREFGALWFALSTNGKADTQAHPSSSTSSPSTTGYRY